MKKFIVIYHAPFSAAQQMASATKEEQAKGMEGWMNWAQKCGNQLVDMGAPLMGGQALATNGASSNSNKDVTGYSVLQANDMKEAISLLQGHPHLAYGAACTIEVHEAMPIPGM
ncbi:MAG: YciI family protein [Flavobacteriales bacterium]